MRKLCQVLIISEAVEGDFRKAVRDEMEVEIWRLFEGSCKWQSEVAALCERLSKCYVIIYKLTLKVQQLLVPLFNEETLDSDEKVYRSSKFQATYI